MLLLPSYERYSCSFCLLRPLRPHLHSRLPLPVQPGAEIWCWLSDWVRLSFVVTFLQSKALLWISASLVAGILELGRTAGSQWHGEKMEETFFVHAMSALFGVETSVTSVLAYATLHVVAFFVESWSMNLRAVWETTWTLEVLHLEGGCNLDFFTTIEMPSKTTRWNCWCWHAKMNKMRVVKSLQFRQCCFSRHRILSP